MARAGLHPSGGGTNADAVQDLIDASLVGPRNIVLTTKVVTGATASWPMPGSPQWTSDRQSDGTIDAALWWDEYLQPGTWALAFMQGRSTNRGIYNIEIADLDAAGSPGAFTTLGTIDGYNSGADTVFSELTGLSVATGGQKRLRIRMHTKNGSSSAYYGVIKEVVLRCTLPL